MVLWSLVGGPMFLKWLQTAAEISLGSTSKMIDRLLMWARTFRIWQADSLVNWSLSRPCSWEIPSYCVNSCVQVIDLASGALIGLADHSPPGEFVVNHRMNMKVMPNPLPKYLIIRSYQDVCAESDAVVVMLVRAAQMPASHICMSERHRAVCVCVCETLTLTSCGRRGTEGNISLLHTSPPRQGRAAESRAGWSVGTR